MGKLEKSCAAYALPFLATASIGLLSGFLTAEAGPYPEVLDSVIPAVIALLTGAVIWLWKSGKHSLMIPVSLIVIVFCASFFAAMLKATDARSAQKISTEKNLINVRAQAYQRLLVWCALTEISINEFRLDRGLEALKPEQVCDYENNISPR